MLALDSANVRRFRVRLQRLVLPKRLGPRQLGSITRTDRNTRLGVGNRHGTLKVRASERRRQ